MKLVAVLVVLSFGSLALGQQPKPCESPKEWVAKVSQTYYTEEYVGKNLGEWSYDADNQRQSFVGKTMGYGTFNSIMLYTEQKVYTVYTDPKNVSKCTVSKLDHEFIPIGFPKASDYQYAAMVGSTAVPGSNVLTFTAGGRFPGSKYMFYEITVTAAGCVPVQIEAHGETSKSPSSQLRFYDVVPKKVDPKTFDIPSICQHGV